MAVLELSQLAESKALVGLGRVAAFHVCTRHGVLLTQARTMKLGRRVASKHREGPQGRSRSSAALRTVQLGRFRLQCSVCPPHCPCPALRGRAREAQSLSTEPRGAPARRARGHAPRRAQPMRLGGGIRSAGCVRASLADWLCSAPRRVLRPAGRGARCEVRPGKLDARGGLF